MACLLKPQSRCVVGVGALPERSSCPLHSSLFVSAPSYSSCKEYHPLVFASCFSRLPFAGSSDRRLGKRNLDVKLACASNQLIVGLVGNATATEPQTGVAEVPSVTASSLSTASPGEETSLEAKGNLLSLVNGGDSERQSRTKLPPRICTLRAFGKSGEGVVAPEPDAGMSSFCKSVADSVEFAAKIQDWEILSGRLAMMVFISAVLLEALTGNNVFEKTDSQRILVFFSALVVSVLGSAGFALAWQAKTRVTYTMSKGYENLINGLIDNVIDGLLFDEET